MPDNSGIGSHDFSPFANMNELLNNMNEMFYTIDTTGRLTYVNQKSLDMMGYKPEEVIGHYLWDLVPEKTRENTKNAVMDQLLNGKRETFRVAAVHRDGTRKILRLNISPLITEGVVYGQMGLAEDVTDLHYSEKALKEYNRELRIIKDELMASNQQLQAVEEELRQQLDEAENNKLALAEAHQQIEAIFNFLPDPTFVLDAEGRVTMWNQAIEELTGVRAREILGRGNREYSRVFYGYRRPMSIDQSLGGREPDEEEVIVFSHSRVEPGQNQKHPLNNEIYLSGKSSPLYDNNGRLLGAIESLRDITENRRAQQALIDSEEKYRNIIESIEDGYFEVDYAGNFTFVNPWLYKVIGYDEKDLLGHSYRAVMDEENIAKVYEAFNHVYKTGQSVKEFAWQVIRKDGRTLFVETTILPIKEGDAVIGFRGIVHDISERQAAEEALRKSENLYRTIFETTGTAMAILEEDMTMSLVNHEMTNITGISKEDFEGKLKWTEIVAPEHRDMMRSYHQLRRKDQTQLRAIMNLNCWPGMGQNAIYG
ncbi:PAS domain S-box protein [Syntrophomonas palmitatica]|uniref:PAS domain S-box protein n=1 Tax=Syntrophomonas palmitatica TaxID=402877 RepID=UPI0006D1DEAA|nr:PAS domain S-box protein [Syntrophomonas palmitatica]